MSFTKCGIQGEQLYERLNKAHAAFVLLCLQYLWRIKGKMSVMCLELGERSELEIRICESCSGQGECVSLMTSEE